MASWKGYFEKPVLVICTTAIGAFGVGFVAQKELAAKSDELKSSEGSNAKLEQKLAEQVEATRKDREAIERLEAELKGERRLPKCAEITFAHNKQNEPPESFDVVVVPWSIWATGEVVFKLRRDGKESDEVRIREQGVGTLQFDGKAWRLFLLKFNSNKLGQTGKALPGGGDALLVSATVLLEARTN